MSKAEKSEREPGDLDMSSAARGVWLVKVPKYLSEKWQKCPDSREVGKLRINKSRTDGGKPEVIFSLDSRLAVTNPAEKNSIPKDHKFVLTGLGRQSLSVLSAIPTGQDDADPAAANEILSLEGKVIQRAECRPVADANYMALKRTNFELSNNPARQVVQLSKAVVNNKPRARQMNAPEPDSKLNARKRIRLEKDRVMDILYSAFEKHQYYSLKDLVRITDQPVPFLKEILKEICVYNLKAPHKNMWELKSEYRHYSGEKSTDGKPD